MSETQTTISTWATETFGDAGSNFLVAARANVEMAELLRGLGANDNDPKALEECADVLIVLFRLADRMGGDLLAEVNRKMAINRKRQWVLRGDGTGDHYGRNSDHAAVPHA